LVSDAPPIVAVGPHAGNPHYEPTAGTSTALGPGEVLLLDLWGKVEQPGAVYADITWMGFSGEPPAEVARVLLTAIQARDAAIAEVQTKVAAGVDIRGWEVDRAARRVVEQAGFGGSFVHRTGHSLGEEVHGSGVNMDDYETHDDRRLVPGTGFTIEPGIYLPAFGVRTEVNVVIGPGTTEVTGPRQETFVRV
jgi:Xaa-Pro aminopeptidase